MHCYKSSSITLATLALLAIAVLGGCAQMSASFPIEMPDGTIERVTVEGSSPGAVCVFYEVGESFMFSTRPESDFGTSSTIESLMSAAVAFFTKETPAEKAARKAMTDACAFRFTNSQNDDEDEDGGE